jgi:integrase
MDKSRHNHTAERNNEERARAHVPDWYDGGFNPGGTFYIWLSVFSPMEANDFSGWSKSKAALDKLSGVSGWTLHDLRRTFATNLAALGTPIHVTERLLNHVSGTQSGIVAVYQRHSYMPEMTKAVEASERHLRALVERAKIAA